jgi:hypothetical protein
MAERFFGKFPEFLTPWAEQGGKFRSCSGENGALGSYAICSHGDMGIEESSLLILIYD